MKESSSPMIDRHYGIFLFTVPFLDPFFGVELLKELKRLSLKFLAKLVNILALLLNTTKGSFISLRLSRNFRNELRLF